MKIIFMGTSEFAVPALQALIRHPSYRPIAVYTAAAKKAGRGLKLQKSPIHLLSEQYDIPVYTPANFKDPGSELLFKEIDLAVVAAYGLILPTKILTSPRLGCINIHPSSLPRWRGAAPIQRAIISGDQDTSVCIIKMDAGCDTGPVIIRKDYAIPQHSTSGSLSAYLADEGSKLLLEAIKQIESGTAQIRPQNEEGSCYAQKIEVKDTLISWASSAHHIECQVRGLHPKPNAKFSYNGEHIKLIEAKTYQDDTSFAQELPIGSLIIRDNRYLVRCDKASYLELQTLQKAGGQPMSAPNFFNGFRIGQGSILNDGIELP